VSDVQKRAASFFVKFCVSFTQCDFTIILHAAQWNVKLTARGARDQLNVADDRVNM